MERDDSGDGTDEEDEPVPCYGPACPELTEGLLRRFERNDPSLSSFTVQSEDWLMGAGIVFAQCKVLKMLRIILGSETHWFAELCAGIVYNETIEHLRLVFDRSYGDGRVDALRLLAPFLRNNLNLRSFEMRTPYDIDIVPMGGSKLESLASAFQGRKSGLLKNLHISWSSTSDREVEALFKSLEGQHNLRYLSFRTNVLERLGCKALGSLLNNPACRVHTLELQCKNMSADWFASLCYALAKNNTVRQLDLSNIDPLSVSSCLAISLVLSQPLSALKKLQLSYNDFRDEGISILGNALALNTTLQHLDLNNSCFITEVGWQAFSNCLRNPHSALKELILWGCEMVDQDAATFAAALAGNTSLRTLDLDNNHIESTGLVALLNNKSVLEELYINSIEFDYGITEEEWCVLSRILCDKTTIWSTFSSNHTFHSCQLFEDMICDGVPHGSKFREVYAMMTMNKVPNKTEVARRKILDNHFLQGNTGMNALGCMHETALPNAIEWMGRDLQGYSAMFEFVRDFPTVFDVTSSAYSDNSKKRKLA